MRNLLDGHGLVFNPGERVEGYSNFLWALQLAFAWGVLGVGPETASLALGWASTALAAGVVVRLAWTTPFAREVVAVIALLLLATNHSFAVWCTSGLETRQVTALLLLSILLLHRAAWSPRGLLVAGASFALVGLERPEGMLFGACGGAWLVVEGWRTGRRIADTARAVALLAAPQVAVAGAHLAFRLAYYGAPLPNTFYAKAESWPLAGFAYLGGAVVEHGLVALAPLAAIGAWARARRGDTLHVLAALVVLPHLAVLAWVGGDHFEYRMLDPVFPLLFLAVADGALALAEALRPRWRPVGAGLIVAIALPYALVVPWMEDVATRPARERYFHALHVDLTAEHGGLAWSLPGVPALAGAYNRIRTWERIRLVAARWAEHRGFQAHRDERFRPYADVRLPPGLVMAEGSVGVAPFHLSDVAFIDAYGLTDPVIARLPALPNPPGKLRRLAHPRKDYAARMRERGTNIGIQPHERSIAGALAATKHALWLGPGSWMPFHASPLPGPLVGKRVVTRDPIPGPILLYADRTWRVERVLGSFGDLDGWTATGTAFATPAPHARPGQSAVSGNLGPFLDSYTAADRDRATGTLRSPPFVLERGQHLAFLVGGGAKPGLGVSVVGPDGPIATHRGQASEAMRLVIVPLGEHVGVPLHIEVVDHATGAWGHVLADEMVLVREIVRPKWLR
ncbi:MAG: hypothetical protein H6737_29690 [Alphaproteobacteria bacterium]|nr:hypothetical protein [Alphaproteobacteria bacterium]